MSATDSTHLESFDETSWIITAGGAFAARVHGSPELVDLTDRVLDRLTQSEITPDSLQRIGFALTQVHGEEAGRFLALYLAAPDPEQFVRIMEEAGEPDEDAVASGVAAMRKLQALYGYPVGDAGRLDEADPDDWVQFDRQVYFDTVVADWFITSVIGKANGENMKIVGRPNSVINLVSSLLNSINFVGEDYEFDPDVLDRFQSELSPFLGRRSNSPGRFLQLANRLVSLAEEGAGLSTEEEEEDQENEQPSLTERLARLGAAVYERYEHQPGASDQLDSADADDDQV